MHIVTKKHEVPKVLTIFRKYSGRKTYCAHENALSRASRLPPINGAGGSGSKAIHQPTGILTVLIPCLYRKLKSSTVIKLFLCLCSYRKPKDQIGTKSAVSSF